MCLFVCMCVCVLVMAVEHVAWQHTRCVMTSLGTAWSTAD